MYIYAALNQQHILQIVIMFLFQVAIPEFLHQMCLFYNASVICLKNSFLKKYAGKAFIKIPLKYNFEDAKLATEMEPLFK